MEKAKSLPLDGIRVVDFTRAWAGPMCTRLLAEMGAEVIKIENPEQPDVGRLWLPFAEGNRNGLNRSGMFAFMHGGEKDCLLNLKQPEGLEAIKRLIKISDIVVENFAPRVMDSLGIGYSVLKEIKPDLIMISESGYGAYGPLRDNVAFQQVLEAYSGIDLLIGYPGGPPMGSQMPTSDQTAATLAAFAALAALHYRDLTGEGQHVDVSEIETLLVCMPEAFMEFTMNGRVLQAQGNRDDVMAPHNCYRCQGKDSQGEGRWVAIAVGSDSEWKDFCLVMGKPGLIADERFRDGFCRLKNQDELDKIVTEWTSGQTAIDIMTQLQKVNIAAGPVYNAEDVHNDPHLRAREFFVEIDHPEVGKRRVPGVLARLSETPWVVRRDPLFGEHTDWVLHELLASNENK